MFVNVPHSTLVRRVLLPNAIPVGKRMPADDHLREELLAMDWVGNVHRGVALQYNYCSEAQRPAAFDELSWKTIEMTTSAKVYRAPTS